MFLFREVDPLPPLAFLYKQKHNLSKNLGNPNLM